MSVVSEQEKARVQKYEKDIALLRENYYKQTELDKAYLDKVAAEIAQYETEFSGLVSSLNARKDRNYIFFEANTPKNAEINVELNRVKVLQDVIKGIKSNITKFLEDNIEKPKRMAEARAEISNREQARNAILASMEPAAQTLRRQAQDNFTRAFKSEPLDREDALRLIRLEEGLDKLKMAGVDANIFQKGAEEIQNLVKDAVAASEIIGAETFYTAGNTVALLLGWWIILPMKAVSFASDLISRSFRATEAFFQTFNEYAHKQADQSGIPGQIAWGALRFLTGGITLLAAGVKGITRLVSDIFDVDKMIRKGNMGAAFGIGFLGAAVLISFAIASVFTLGIPIAMIAVGAGFAAAIGLAKVGIEYNKFKETRAARRNFQLTSSEEARLLEFEQRNPKFREEMSREREANLQAQTTTAKRGRQLEQDEALARQMQVEPKKLSRQEERAPHDRLGALQDRSKFRPEVAQPRASGESYSRRVEEEPATNKGVEFMNRKKPKERKRKKERKGVTLLRDAQQQRDHAAPEHPKMSDPYKPKSTTPGKDSTT